MNIGIKTILYPVKDLVKARAMFSQLLGIEPHADAPYYVGFQVGDQEIGLNPNWHAQGMDGPVAYYHVSNIQESLQALLAAGAQAQQAIMDVGGGRLIASVKDADGNLIGLIQDK